MKKWICLALAACLAAGLTACGGAKETADDTKAEQTGTAAEEKKEDETGVSDISQNADGFIEIHSAEDFVRFAELFREEAINSSDRRVNLNAVLMADIDLSDAIPADSTLLPLGGEYSVEKDGKESTVWASFAGEFDGNGHTISGIHLDVTDRGRSAGLFHTVYTWDDPAVSIHDLTIADSSFSGNANYMGAFAGSASTNTLFENCTVAETVTVESSGESSRTGGIAGYAEEGGNLFYHCMNYGTVTGSDPGGILGGAGSDTCLVQCDNYGSVTGERSAAGIINRHDGSSGYAGIVIGCVNYGEVQSAGTACGIVCTNGSTLRSCVNAGRVEGTDAFAIGEKDGSIYACGNIGTVASDDLYIYRFGYSWDLGTYEGFSEEEVSENRGYTGEALMGKDIEVIPMDPSAAADGSLTAILQEMEDYGAWTQGDGFPVWDGTGGVEKYERICEVLEIR